MYKVFVVAAIITVACGRPQHKDAHAISSQSIVLHTDHAHEGQNTHGLIQLQHGLQQHNNQHGQHYVDYYAHPQYAFEYKIQDPHTGDNKYQHETRDGDVVKGVYSLHEADGTIRIVEYSADKHSGFNAIVKQVGHAQHIQPEHQQYYH